MIRRVIPEAARILLIILFTYAAFSKLITYPRFIMQLESSPLPSITHSIAWIIPLGELLLASLLVSQTYFRLALYLSGGLLLLFSLYIIGILTIADYVPCACGGVLESLSWTEHLFFNGFFLFVTLVALRFMGREGESLYPLNKKDMT